MMINNSSEESQLIHQILEYVDYVVFHPNGRMEFVSKSGLLFHTTLEAAMEYAEKYGKLVLVMDIDGYLHLIIHER